MRYYYSLHSSSFLSPAGGAADTADGTEDRPIFLLEPRANYYIVKNKAVTITCQARQAVQLHFRCAGHWMRPEQVVTEELVDNSGKTTYLQTSLEVTRTEVEDYLGLDGYSCECHALNAHHNGNKPLKVISRSGLVQVACEYAYVYNITYIMCIYMGMEVCVCV